MSILSSLKIDHPDVVYHGLGPAAGPLGRRIASFAAHAAEHDAVVLHGAPSLRSRYDDLLAAWVVSRRHPDKPVVLAACIWEPGSRALSRLVGARRPAAIDTPGAHLHGTSRFALSRLAAPNVHCSVLTAVERETFPRLWGFPADHVHEVRYWSANSDTVAAAVRADPGEAYVFAGGDSLRDYRTLIDAAPAIDAPVVIATRLPRPSTLPPNVTYGPQTRERYDELAANATVTVVPLVHDSLRSGGQKTYLAAMALGQALVVPDAPGVRDYVTPGRTGLVPPAQDAAALAADVNRLLREPATRAELGRAARVHALTDYTREAYARRLYGLAERLCGQQVGPAARHAA